MICCLKSFTFKTRWIIHEYSFQNQFLHCDQMGYFVRKKWDTHYYKYAFIHLSRSVGIGQVAKKQQHRHKKYIPCKETKLSVQHLYNFLWFSQKDNLSHFITCVFQIKNLLFMLYVSSQTIQVYRTLYKRLICINILTLVITYKTL